MYDLSIEYQIDEFMIYCRSRELRAKTLESYEHTLRLFERWCNDELNITQVDQVTESVIRRYITNLQERGKYTFSFLSFLDFALGRNPKFIFIS